MNENRDGIVRVGPAGWSYPDWAGIVYPPGLPRAVHPLSLLGQWFDTVEINSSFYRPVDPRHAEGWLRHTAPFPGFRFTAKHWERYTHTRGEWPGDADARRVRDGLAPLHDAGRLAALLLQFPWSFKRTPENRQWLARIADTFAAFPLVLEVRHDSWNVPEVHAGLAERGIAWCNIDQPLHAHAIEPGETVTAPLAYVRLHGRNAADWFRQDAGRDERYNYLYSADELAPWILRIQRMRARAREIYVVTNNHFRGQAVANAFEIRYSLGQRTGAPPPDTLVRAYPGLRAVRPEAPG